MRNRARPDRRPFYREDRDSSSAHSVGTRRPAAAPLGMTADFLPRAALRPSCNPIGHREYRLVSCDAPAGVYHRSETVNRERAGAVDVVVLEEHVRVAPRHLSVAV